jgi:hypothetical protein
MKINDTYEILTPNGFKSFYGINKIKKKFIIIQFDNNITIHVSFNHLIYDFEGNEIIATKLKIGDKIKSQEGYLTVIDIQKKYYAIDLYDIINAGENQVYYTNGIVSHNCSFLGSGDNVIDIEIIVKQERENCQNPVKKEWMNDLWIWKDPEPNHRYVAGLDVSRGDSDDSTGFEIVDFDTWEQVLEYHGKMPPDFAASLLMTYGLRYQAFTCIDITGGMGVATSRKLKELKYPDKLLYYDGLTPTELFGGAPEDALAGINFSAQNHRVQIVQALEEAVRVGGLKIRSLRLTNELRKFVYTNGKPDHVKGAHDDLIMALGMALFVGNTSFTLLQKSTAQLDAMAQSWKKYELTNRPILEQNPAAMSNNQHKEIQLPFMPETSPYSAGMGREAYRQYRWLFGVTQKQIEEYKKSGVEPTTK